MNPSMAKGFLDAGLKLASRLIANQAKNKNFVFSPASINVALSLLSSGSTGETLDEFLSFFNAKNTDELKECVNKIMADLLADGVKRGSTTPDVPDFSPKRVRRESQPRVPDSLRGGFTGRSSLRYKPYVLSGRVGGDGEDFPPKLAVANAVWIDGSMRIKDMFQLVAKNIYKADVKPVDFQTKYNEVQKEVNSWAEEKTNGLIKHLLPPGSVDSYTRLILTNAIYFKGSWVTNFKASSTKDRPFRLLSGKYVEAPFMTNREDQYVTQFDGFKVLGLRYKNGGEKRRFSMYIFLPDANDGLPALAENLSSGCAFVDNHIPRSRVKLGKFLIPKFKMTYDFDASKVLEDMGIVSPFRLPPNGLTEIADSSTGEELFVSKVIHKAFIEVNEEGTEAAAATAICMASGCAWNPNPPKLMDFVADHPFLFVIREDVTGLVLFVGQVLNPTEE